MYNTYKLCKKKAPRYLEAASETLLARLALLDRWTDALATAIRANPKPYLPLPAKYAPIKLQSLPKALAELEAENSRLQSRIAAFEEEFRQENGRIPGSLFEMCPQLRNYDNLAQVKHHIQLIQFKLDHPNLTDF